MYTPKKRQEMFCVIKMEQATAFSNVINGTDDRNVIFES